MRKLFLYFILGVLLVSPGYAFGEDNGKLQKIVVLSRHGVRAPTQHKHTLELWSKKVWPKWPVERGELTPRGANLVTAMWKGLKKNIDGTGLLSGDICQNRNSVYVRADVDQRTQATAHAILKGLAPDCAVEYAVADGDVDPLFHPVKAGLYKYNPVPTATNVLAMTNGGMQNMQETFSGALSLLDRISGPPSEELCERFSLGPNCAISDVPNAISIASNGSSVRLAGALSIASSMAEIFLLEYGEWPETAAGWGQVNGSVLSQLMPVHARIFDVVNRAPIVAWASGSSLLKEMADALAGNHYDPKINEAKLVIFVGHDTNLANIGALMGINWQAAGYPSNDIPPASALFLELWDVNGQQQVRLKYYAQTPKVLHSPFTSQAGDHDAVAVPASMAGGQTMIELPGFMDKMRRAIEGAPLAPEKSVKIRERLSDPPKPNF